LSAAVRVTGEEIPVFTFEDFAASSNSASFNSEFVPRNSEQVFHKKSH